MTKEQKISIHSPHARGDDALQSPGKRLKISIHSPHARGDLVGRIFDRRSVISIHSPHARGDDDGTPAITPPNISIHSPHARGDQIAADGRRFSPISIHSPHARGDDAQSPLATCAADFNPLPSCEGRRGMFRPPASAHGFQSTPLMRGETIIDAIHAIGICISIHSPHARGDSINL